MAQVIEDIVGGRGGFGFGGGDSGIGIIALLALLGRRGGLGGEGDCGGEGKFLDAAILNGVNALSASVPTTALETQAAINNSIANLALGVQQGFANVKDSVQANGTANLLATNASERTTLTSAALNLAAIKDSQYATAISIRDDGDKTRGLLALYHEGNLQRELGVAQSALAEERNHSRIREVEVSVNQSVNQTQAQGQVQTQQQQQFQLLAGLVAAVNNLAGDIQAVKQGQVIFNSGTMAASGTQAAANTKVA